MRILHIVPSYPPALQYGGVPLSVSRLATEFTGAGADVTVLTTLANGVDELEIPAGEPQLADGIPIYYFKRWTGDHSHFSPGLLWAVWRSACKADVVLVHSWWNLVALGAVLLCRLAGARVVLFPHGMLSPYSIKNRWRRFFQKTIGAGLLRGVPIFATSEQEAAELHELHPQNAIFIFPNIIEIPPQIKRPARDATAPFRLLFLSRIDPKKGLDLLFEALAGLTIPWRLSIAGDGDAAYLAEMRQQEDVLNLADRIEWLGWVEGLEKWALLAASDLVVLPSHNENFALVVLEALALGTPVVVSDQVGLSAYVEDKGLGWVTPLTAVSLCQTLQMAFEQTAERKRIQQVAPEQVRRDFNPKQLANQYLKQLACLK